jgi:hypothetical protein
MCLYRQLIRLPISIALSLYSVKYLQTSKAYLPSDLSKLPQVAKESEVALYREAPSKEAYLDTSSLKQRLVLWKDKLLRKDKNLSPKTVSKLPQTTKQSEVTLYPEAPSKEAYLDTSSLKQRLVPIPMEVSRKNCRRRSPSASNDTIDLNTSTTCGGDVSLIACKPCGTAPSSSNSPDDIDKKQKVDPNTVGLMNHPSPPKNHKHRQLHQPSWGSDKDTQLRREMIHTL